jgi:hypothetical protein
MPLPGLHAARPPEQMDKCNNSVPSHLQMKISQIKSKPITVLFLSVLSRRLSSLKDIRSLAVNAFNTYQFYMDWAAGYGFLYA